MKTKPNTTNSIGSRIRSMRRSTGRTQHELGQLIGVREMRISMLELDKAKPSLEEFEALAKVFECSLDELRYGKHKTPRANAERIGHGKPRAED